MPKWDSGIPFFDFAPGACSKFAQQPHYMGEAKTKGTGRINRWKPTLAYF